MLTGNFGDLSFDGQPLIAVEGPQGVSELCLMGQSPEPGWAAVGGWANLSQSAEQLCDPAQRPMLAELGAAIAPGSGDARENAYAHTVTWADLSLPAAVAPAEVVLVAVDHAGQPVPIGDCAARERLG